jgi:chorismate dehydratase
VPMERIRSLALDEGSRTSATLVRILLRERVGITPKTSLLPIGADARDADTDAVLLIGDRAIQPPTFEFVEQWDVGEQWCSWAELPFVFAMWVARSANLPKELAVALQAARDAGVQNLQSIAQQEADRVGLSIDACLSYLRDNLYFYLGPREQQGLELFRQHAAATGLAPVN